MSRENVEVVRRAWQAATAKPPDWQTINELYDARHVLHTDWGGVNDSAYQGAAGYRGALADMDEAWHEWTQQIDDVIDAGGDAVVVAARLVAKGKHSSAPVDRPYGVVMTVEGGRIVRTRAYGTVDEALEAAGRASKPCRGRTWRRS